MISLKGHSIMAFELTARRRGVNRHRYQLLVCQPAARCALDFSAQALDQFGQAITWLHRMAAQTGTITIMQCLARGCEKIDVFARRLFRRTRWPAKDAGRANAGVKYAFEARVATHQCPIHRFGWRKKFERFHMRSTPKV